MIQYALKCAKGHKFESWFQSANAYDRLVRAGHVACAICGENEVEKDIMTPRVTVLRKGDAPQRVLDPETERAAQLATLRKRVEETSDYVGADFASEARAIHDGDKPNRAIYGEARPDEARSLIEDGVPVAPLPFMSTRKTN